MSKLIIKSIGVGNATSKINFNQSFLVSAYNNDNELERTMLIDAGNQVYAALNYHEIDIKSIDDIYISHGHEDHTGSLATIAIVSYDWINKPNTYKDFKAVKPKRLLCEENFISILWENILKGKLDTVETVESQLETFFEPCPISNRVEFDWVGGWKLRLIQQIHVYAGSHVVTCHGIMFVKNNYPSIYFTCDTQFFQPPQVLAWTEKADIIIQDCETNKFPSGVHAHINELIIEENTNSRYKLKKDIKEKMYLSHYSDNVTLNQGFDGEYFDWNDFVISKGFKGFLKLGSTITINKNDYRYEE